MAKHPAKPSVTHVASPPSAHQPRKVCATQHASVLVSHGRSQPNPAWPQHKHRRPRHSKRGPRPRKDLQRAIQSTVLPPTHAAPRSPSHSASQQSASLRGPSLTSHGSASLWRDGLSELGSFTGLPLHGSHTGPAAARGDGLADVAAPWSTAQHRVGHGAATMHSQGTGATSPRGDGPGGGVDPSDVPRCQDGVDAGDSLVQVDVAHGVTGVGWYGGDSWVAHGDGAEGLPSLPSGSLAGHSTLFAESPRGRGSGLEQVRRRGC